MNKINAFRWFVCSTVASNNVQIRCNFVDLYYSLFGSKTPNCLAKNEQPLTSGLPKIPKIPKLSDKRSVSPFDGDEIKPKPATVETPVNGQESLANRDSDAVSKIPQVKEEPTEIIPVNNCKVSDQIQSVHYFFMFIVLHCFAGGKTRSAATRNRCRYAATRSEETENGILF